MRRRNADGLARGREPAEQRTTPFESVRKAHLEASDRWPQAASRVWAEPNPVGVDETYKVSFEADCDCSAALFVIHDSVQAISLLYPSGEPAGHLAPRVPRDVVAVPRSKANPAEGVATEILLLLVSPEAVPITQPLSTARIGAGRVGSWSVPLWPRSMKSKSLMSSLRTPRRIGQSSGDCHVR